MPNYTLDFETIRQMMQAYQQTGLLSAEVASGVGTLHEPCYIEINILAGLITSCAVISVSGRRLMGKEAARELPRLGRLRWTFNAQQEAMTQSGPLTPMPEERHLFPQRIAYLEQSQIRSFSRLHRAVFALTDGTKSAAKIAEILSISPDLVDQALNDLQSLGVVTLGRQDDERHR